MSLWNNQTPPVLYPDAVATPAGWADPKTGELLVTVTGLSTFKNEGAGTQLVNARIIGAKVQGAEPVVLKKTFAAGDVMVVEAMFLEPVVKTGGTPTMTITINGNARTFTNYIDSADFVAQTKGKITSVTIGGGGSGYVQGDTLTFTGGGGAGAKAIVSSVSGGAITGIEITDPGYNYTSAPTVGGGSGSSATLTAVVGKLANGPGTNRWLFGYTVASAETATAAQIVFPAGVTGVFDASDDALGASAAATAVVSTGVTSVTVTAGGSGYTSAPDVVFTGGTPTVAATAVANLDKGLGAVTVTAGGSNYTTAPTVTITPNPGSSASATAVLATSGGIKSVTVGGSGTGYTNGDALIFTPTSGGSGAAGTINVSGGNITSVTMTAAGSGYITAPTVTTTTPGGSGNTLTAVIGKAVASVTTSVAGSGFTSAPTIGFTGGGGSGATATAATTTLTDVLSVTITNPGSGYGGTPTVSFQNGGGTSATATATTSGVISAVNVTNGGSNYWSVPTVGFSTGSAAATAVVSHGVVTGVTITNPGSSYVSAPTVTFTQPSTSVTNPTFNGTPSAAGFTVDGVAPTITGVTVTGEESTNTFVTNNFVTITLTTSKPVYVNTAGGTPYIVVNIGSSHPHATYIGGSGTNTLVFEYEIGLSDTCTASNFSISSPVVLNSGTIKDLPGNNLTLTFSAPSTSSVTVNNPILPTISSVVLVGGPTFVTSDTISLTVTCDENVYVNTSFGVPQIELFINNHGQFATYASGSGTTALTFSYTVTSLDSATAGTFSTGSTIMMNGGNITDINSVNLPGSFTPPSTSSVTVN